MPSTGIGVGASAARGRLWTPRALGASVKLWIDPARATTLPGGVAPSNGTGIASIADAAGGSTVLTQATSGKRYAYNTTNAIAGRPSIDSLAASSSEMSSATGGLVGNVAHAMFAYVQFTATTGQYNSVTSYGPPTGAASCQGLIAGGTAWWAGRLNSGTPNSVGTGAADLNVHLLEKSWDPNTGLTTMRVDGDVVISSGQIASYNLTAELGLYSYAAGTTGTFRLYQALFVAAEFESAGQRLTRLRTEGWFGRCFGYRPTRLWCDGDSITAGVGTNATSNGGTPWPTAIAALLTGYGGASPVTIVNLGISGEALSSMVTAAPTAIDRNRAGQRRKEIVVIAGGSNDLQSGVAAATVYADLVAYCAARRAAGFRVIVCTIMKRASQPAAAATYNALVIANAATIADGLVDLAADPRLDYTVTPANWQNDNTHPNDAGAAVIASLIAPVVNGLL